VKACLFLHLLTQMVLALFNSCSISFTSSSGKKDAFLDGVFDGLDAFLGGEAISSSEEASDDSESEEDFNDGRAT
jgi:hypothetical protein